MNSDRFTNAGSSDHWLHKALERVLFGSIRAFIPVWLTFLLLIPLGLGGLILYNARFDVYSHSISRTISNRDGKFAEPAIEFEVVGWRRQILLTPKEFELGDDGAAVRRRISDAGYRVLSSDADWGRLSHYKKEGHTAFTRNASNFVCGLTLGVFVEFDENDKLVSAFGSANQGYCL